MIGAIVTGKCRNCALQGQQIVHARPVQKKLSRPFLGRIRSRNVAIRAAEQTAEASTTPVPEEADASESTKAAQEPEPEPIKFVAGDIVKVDREKYYASVTALATDHPENFAGLGYIFEDRGEILEVRDFISGTHAYVAWAGIPTAPAWLPVELLIKVDKLVYKRV